jgi:CcmD family protein
MDVAAENPVPEDRRKKGQEVYMKEGLGFVMAVNLIIWCGIAVYLFVLDRKIAKLEKEL